MPSSIKLLLKESVKHLGRVGDVVEVSSGYARNYLLPNDLAMQPTPGNLRKVEERRKEIERLERERREQQERLIKQLEGAEVALERRSNEQGHLYGAVSATDIARALQIQGFNVEPDDIELPGRLDRVDTYQVRVRLAEELQTDVKVWVAPDPESRAAIEEARKAKEREAAAAQDEAEAQQA